MELDICFTEQDGEWGLSGVGSNLAISEDDLKHVIAALKELGKIKVNKVVR